MTTTIDCDHVFDVLTRGPFHSEESSDLQIETHLAGCHECRQLAEALRPAVSLLHESLDGDEAATLPGYHGTLPRRSYDDLPAAVAAAIAADESPAAPSRSFRPAPRRLRGAAAQLAYGGLTAAAVCAAVWIIAASTSSPSPFIGEQAALPGRADIGRGLPDGQGLVQLKQLNISKACFKPQDAATAAAGPSMNKAGSQMFQCCARCHSPGSSTATAPNAVAAVAQSCTACHKLALLRLSRQSLASRTVVVTTVAGA